MLLNFDQNRVVGKLLIDESVLPDTPNYVFSLGYRATEVSGVDVVKHELLAVSLMSDAEYQQYLLEGP